jgi:oligo-alginate lyase
MKPVENISRRSLIKLMVLASPAMCSPASLLARAVPGQSKNGDIGVKLRLPQPRLFYNSSSLERIGQMLAADAAAHAALKGKAEQLMAASLVPETAAMQGEGQHANYSTPARQIAEMGLTLGLLYHLTGDKRYADKLREALLHYGKYVRWAGQRFADRSPPWHSELNTATFSFGYATGYDALRHILPEADRKTIAEAMTRLAVLPTLNDWVLPGTRIHSFDSMGHNWWGVCVAGAGLCALASLDDDPRAPAWIDAIDSGFEQWFNYPGNVLQNRMPTFERSGPSYEGVNYTNYGVSEYLHYRLAWQNTFPDRKAARMKPLEQVAGFFLHTLYPTSTGFQTVNFEDSPLEADSTPTVLLLIACGLGTPEASRYLELVHTHPPGTLLSLLRQHPRPAGHVELPNSYIYPHMGWALMRSSWENDATLLAMKSGYTWNHAHADAGSFILFHAGVPLIIDSGTCAYNRPEYTTYYRQSQAHNVILFDGSGQPKEDVNSGCKFPGHMHSLLDGLGLKYVFADATGPMARWFSRNYRYWLWSGDVILVVDDVRAHTPGQMDWLLHYAGEYTAQPDGGVMLKNGPAKALVKMIHPPVKLREETGLAEHNPDKKAPYLVFSPDAPSSSRQFITAICLNPQAAPKFEVLEGQNYVGVRVQTQDAVEEFYLNLRAVNSPGSISLRIGDWATDAYLLHFKHAASDNSAGQRFLLGDGSYLRHGERSVIESLSKLTACWSPGDSVEVFSDTTSAAIQLAAERRPKRVQWNGRPVPIQYDQRNKLVSLQFRGQEI